MYYQLVQSKEFSDELDELMANLEPTRRADFEAAIDFQISRDPMEGTPINENQFIWVFKPLLTTKFPTVVIAYQIIDNDNILLLGIKISSD